MSIIVKPFAWFLMWLYEFTHSYALALILFSLAVKLVLFPFYMKGKKGMMRMSRLQPKMQELQKKYEGSNQQKYSMELQKLYKEEGVSPMSGCIWNLIPFPFLIMLYSIIRKPITHMMGLAETALTTIAEALTGLGVAVSDYTATYGQMTLAKEASPFADTIARVVPGFVAIDFTMWGLDLASTPSFLFFIREDPWHWAKIGLWLIPIVSGALALAQTLISQKMNPPMESAASANTKTMLYMMPLISVWIGYAMPAGMSIYWIANSVLGIVQDVIATLHYRKVFAREDADKLAAAEEKRRQDEEKRRIREEKLALEGPQRDPNTSKKKMHKQERSKAEEAERAYKEKTGQVQPRKTDNDRPFARGRAYDPDRYADRMTGGSHEQE